MARPLLAALLVATSALAACGPLPTTVPLVTETGGTWPHLRDALIAGPLSLTVIGAAYPGATPAQSQALVAEGVETGITWHAVRAVDGATTPPPPKVGHLVWVMDAPWGMDPAPLCGPAPGPALSGAPDPDRARMLVAFCDGSGLSAAVQGSVARTPEDPPLGPARLVRQMIRQLADRGQSEQDNDDIILIDG